MVPGARISLVSRPPVFVQLMTSCRQRYAGCIEARGAELNSATTVDNAACRSVPMAQRSDAGALPNEEVEDSREHGPVSPAGPFARRATPLAFALESFAVGDRSR